jgi:hypothetical protein
MGYKLRVPYAGSTVQVNDILEKVRPAMRPRRRCLLAYRRCSCAFAAVRHNVERFRLGR